MLSLKEQCLHPSTMRTYIQSASGGKDNSPEGAQVGWPVFCFGQIVFNDHCSPSVELTLTSQLFFLPGRYYARICRWVQDCRRQRLLPKKRSHASRIFSELEWAGWKSSSGRLHARGLLEGLYYSFSSRLIDPSENALSYRVYGASEILLEP